MAKYVSKFKGSEIDAGIDEIKTKVGAAYFDPTTFMQIMFKDEDDKIAYINGNTSVWHQKCEFKFNNTINQLNIVNYMESKSLYYTQVSTEALIKVGFKSEEKGVTDTSWREVLEDAYVTVAVDRGYTGQYSTIIDSKLLLNGDTIEFDVLKYIATGNNRVRVTITGADTGSSSNLVYTVMLTTMYLAPSNFKWNVPFIEGNSYSLGGVNIGGNIDKILKIKVSNEQTYSKVYDVNIGTQTYTGIAYSYDGLQFPSEGTGIYNVEMWLDANGLESEHLHYNIICVAKDDVKTAQLVAISDVIPVAKNYDTNKLFSYVIYSGGSTVANPKINVSAIINNTPTPLVYDEVLQNVATGEINSYVMDLEVDTQEANIHLYSSIAVGHSKQEAIYEIDNSAAYPAIPGAIFYLNPANRNNAQANKTTITNESNLATAKNEFAGTWTNISFTDGMDGWTVDNYGRKCLRIPATCKVAVDYAPFANATTRTIEVSYRVENTSNFEEDVMTFASNLTSDFVGARVKPTNVLLHSSLLKTDDLMQGYNTKDEELVHLLITIVQNYKRIGNLAQIYVNGVKKCSFEWSAADTFAHNGTMVLGSDTADLYIYKMRVYTSAFEWPSVMQNFISCLPDTKSKKAASDKMLSVINDGYQIDFDKVKNGGFNYFVLRLPEGKDIPSILNQNAVSGTRLEINIQQNPDFVINGVYENAKTEGQGTTAMNYFRWNFRWKTDEIRITAKKNYASSMHSHKMGGTALFNDLNMMIVGPNEANGRVAVEQYGAYGFIEIPLEGSSDKFTYVPIGLYTIGQDKGDKPTFGYNNKTYKSTLIHLEGTDHSPKAVGMDYPRHKLSVATNSEGDTNYGVVKKDNSVIAAWEIGACGSAETDQEMKNYLDQEFGPAYDVDYYNTSMLVALDAGTKIDDINKNLTVFRATETDLGYTNGDCLLWIDGEYDIYYYDVVEDKYMKDGTNVLTNLGITASSLKGKTAHEKNLEIRQMRKDRYRAQMENYWHLRDNLFHYCFVVLFAATDNFKKNTYPYKFGTLASGSRWRWRQDDLDTMLDINNQGLANKIYSILNGDKSGTTHLFRGNTSYHWTNIQFYYENEIRSMMLEILTAMASLSDTGNSLIEKAVGCVRKYFWNKAQDYFTKSAYNIDAEWSYEEAWAAMKNGTYPAPVHPLQQSLGSHYEAELAWVELRFLFMASMFGFGAFAVGNDSDTTLGQISFRPSQGDNTFRLTPAVNMNPTILIGDSDSKSAGERLMAGEDVELTVSTDGDTTIYIQGADYLSDIGDFSKIRLYAENPALTVQSKRLQRLKVGDENPENVTTVLKTLNVLSCPSISEVDARNVSTLTGTIDLSKCPRLTKALFGGSGAGEIILPNGSKIENLELADTVTNISLVNLPNLGWGKGEMVVTEYVTGKWCRNDQSVGSVCTYAETSDVSYDYCKINCQGYRTLDITGMGGVNARLWCFVDADNKVIKSSAQSVYAKDERLFIPENAVTLVMNFNKSTEKNYYAILNKGRVGGKGKLTMNNLTALTYLRLENNPGIDGFAFLKATFEDGAPLTNVRLVGFDYIGDASDVEILATLANGEYFGIDSDGTRNPGILPVLEGTLTMTTPIYEDDYIKTQESYGAGLVLNLTEGFYIKFNDPEVKRILLSKISSDKLGVRTNEADNTTSLSTWFRANTVIETFDELDKFKNITSLGDGNLNNGTFYNCTNLRSVTLPPKLTTIGAWTFRNCSSLEHIDMPNRVSNVMNVAFENCSSLKSVNLSNTLTELQGGVFMKTGLESVDISNVQKIHDCYQADGVSKGAFRECVKLRSVTLSDKLTYIGSHAFRGCTSLNDIPITSNLSYIGTDAFYGCPLTGLEIDLSGVSNLNGGVFATTGIKKVKFGTPITTNYYGSGGVNWGAFRNCTSLETVEGLEYLENVSVGLFAGCTSLYIDHANLKNVKTCGVDSFTGVSIRELSFDNVTSLPANQWNTSYLGKTDVLEKVKIRGEITVIPTYIFKGYTELSDADIEWSKIKEIGGSAFYNCKSLFIDELDLSSITSLGQTAFYNVNIRKFIMGDELVTMPQSAYSECSYGNKTYLEDVVIGKKITNIPTYAFYGCTALKNVDVDWDNIVSINNYAFLGCTSLEFDEVVLNNIETLGSETFGNVKIRKFVIGDKLTSFPSSGSSVCQFGDKATLEEVVIRGDVATIPAYAFYNCQVLTNVDLKWDAITKIDNYAFDNCLSLVFDELRLPNLATLSTSAFNKVKVRSWKNMGAITSFTLGGVDKTYLEEVYVPSTINTLPANAFDGYTNLTNIVYDKESIESIGNYAFRNCPALEVVDFPNLLGVSGNAFKQAVNLREVVSLGNITTIPDGDWASYDGEGFFGYCTKLSKVNLPDTLSGSIGRGAFRNCVSLTNIDIPDGVTKFNEFAFSGCSGLERLYAKNVTHVEAGAFGRCTSLRELVLPSIVSISGQSNYRGVFNGLNKSIILRLGPNCTTLGVYLFSYSSNVEVTIVCEAVTPPEWAGSPFHGGSGKIPAIYVPAGSMDVYASASTWSSYASSLRPMDELDNIYFNPFGLVLYETTDVPLSATYQLSNVVPTWTIDNDSIATIGDDGVLRFATAGSVTVTASHNGVSTSAVFTRYAERGGTIHANTYVNRSGVLTSANGCVAVANIECVGGNTIEWGTQLGSIDRLCQYDENNTFISYHESTSVTLAPNAKYITFNVSATSIEKAYVKDKLTGVYLWKGTNVN